MKYKLLKTWQLSLQPIIPITYLVLLSQQIYSRILRGKQNMARCTAPVRGHSSAAAAAACPACRNRSGYRRSSYSYDSYPSYSSSGSAGVEAVAVVPAEVQSLAGQNRDLPFPTQPPKYNLSHRFAKR